jgi:hypothetical protein
VALIAAACLGLLIGCVLRFRSDVLAEGLALPLLIAGGFVILSSRTPLGVVAALLLTAYATVLTSA